MSNLKVVVIVGLLLAMSGMAGAIPLQQGPLIFKTYNYEVSAAYSGPAGTYFRDANGNFPGLTKVHTGPVQANEDTWGLLYITQLFTETPPPALPGPGGVFIPDIAPYFTSGTDNHYILGMFYGGQDQVVIIDPNGAQHIGISDLKFNLYDVTGPIANPASLDPNDRVNPDTFPGWNDSGTLLVTGTEYSNTFNGTTGVGPIGSGDVYLNCDATGTWGPLLVNGNWWINNDGNDLLGNPLGGNSDIWQTWHFNAGQNQIGPWIWSQDSGEAFVVPEPLTMLGVCLGITGLGGYIRNRKLARA